MVLCSKGYPGPCETGFEITGLDAFDARDDIVIFQAGTQRDETGRILTSGGRVLGVTALGDDLEQAREAANSACTQVGFAGAFWRSDIGHRVMLSGSQAQLTPRLIKLQALLLQLPSAP